MPILEADLTMLRQECATCGALHTIPLQRGCAKSKREPFALAAADTLEVRIDGGTSPQVITFSASDELAADVAARINAMLIGATADVDGGAVRILSSATEPLTTAIQVVGGTARGKLGFDGRRYGALVLGVTKGQGASKRTSIDTIDLPHCPGCESKECLVRTWDASPAGFAATTAGQHRQLVNALAEHLKSLGYSDPDAKPIHDAEQQAPPDINTTFAAQRIAVSSLRAATRSRGDT